MPAPWRPALVALVFLALIALVLYHDTAAAMVSIWARSDTFAHGFLVPPIVLWLLWRKRREIAAHAPAPAPWFLLPVACAAFVWLLGDLAAANAVSQLAFTALVVFAVPAVAGSRATRTMLFPLAFLYFAVPIGEFLMPWLMARTADFTVLALRLTGIPVYREGLHFIIPSGSWSVVEACSGVRYLIASLMAGTLFAYFNYRSLRRRLLFVVVALLVPIVANWLRAYLIVLWGHFSDNQVAVVADHLIYGWAFFGIVIILMFMIGVRWAEPRSLKSSTAADATPAPPPTGTDRLWLTTAAVAGLMALPIFALQVVIAREDRSAPKLSELSLPGSISAGESAMPDWTPSFQGPSATFQRTYASQRQPVGLYIAYYRRQDAGRKLVSSENVLVRSDDKVWVEVAADSRRVTIGERDVTVSTARLRHKSSSVGATLAVWRVYWINGTLMASDAGAMAYGALRRLLGQGDDGAVVMVYAIEDGPAGADALLATFLRDNLGAIETQLRRTRDGN